MPNDNFKGFRKFIMKFPEEERLARILRDRPHKVTFSLGEAEVLFITKDWDGESDPGDKEILRLTDGHTNCIKDIMEALKIEERGSV